MNLLQALVYGFLSGISEFLPISSTAHRQILQELFGWGNVPLFDFLIHIGVLVALIISCLPAFSRLNRDRQKAASPKRRREVMYTKSMLDLRVLQTALIPLVAGMLLLLFIFPNGIGFPWLALALIVNGVILYFVEHIRQGNKDSRLMSRLDSIFIGIAGSLSVLPGFSRVGMFSAGAMLTGADRHNATNWALILSLPALVVMLGADILQMVSFGVGSVDFATLIYYILGMISAFAGGYASIALLRYFIQRTDYSGFAYYSWGCGLFAFILYLI